MKFMNRVIIFCIINIIEAGEDLYDKEEPSYKYFKGGIDSNSFYDEESIFIGENNAWDRLLFHSFNKEESQNVENNIDFQYNCTETYAITSVFEKQSIELKNNMNITESSQDENNFELEVLDPKDIYEALNQEPATIDNIDDFFNTNNQCEKNEKIAVDVNNGFFNEKYLLKRYDQVYEMYLLKIKNDIKAFIMSNLAKKYLKFYTKRLQSIEIAFNVIRCNGDEFIKNVCLKFSCNNELLTILNCLNANFKNKTFDQETCDQFSEEFDKKLSLNINTTNGKNLLLSLGEYQKLNFYFELMKVYKYTAEIPELITLCGLYTIKLYYEIPFILHLINLFIENTGNLKEQRVFILCLIYAAFTYSERKYLNLFSHEKYNLSCQDDEHLNLYFLLWEVNVRKRIEIQEKMEKALLFKCKYLDKDHFKTIVMIYLYQHMMFLIHYNFSNDVIDNFSKFITEVLNSKKCIACHFNEFLKIFKTQLKVLNLNYIIFYLNVPKNIFFNYVIMQI